MTFNNKEERIKDFKTLFTNNYRPSTFEKYFENKPFMEWLENDGFFTAPASTKYHGAYEGGLYDHSREVTAFLNQMTWNMGLEWQREESPFIIGMFHDICKYDQYIKSKGTRLNGSDVLIYGDGLYHYEYNSNTPLKGHGAKSVMILSQFITLTEEEILCIRYHMGAYEKEEWAEYDLAIKKYPNVLFTHTADMYASKIMEK